MELFRPKLLVYMDVGVPRIAGGDSGTQFVIRNLAKPNSSPAGRHALRDVCAAFAAFEPLTVRKNPTWAKIKREANASLDIWWVV